MTYHTRRLRSMQHKSNNSLELGCTYKKWQTVPNVTKYTYGITMDGYNNDESQVRRLDLAAGGGTFLKYSIGYMQQPRGQTCNGGAPISNGVPGTTAPPLATALVSPEEDWLNECSKYSATLMTWYTMGETGFTGHRQGYSNLQSQNWTESCKDVQGNIINSNQGRGVGGFGWSRSRIFLSDSGSPIGSFFASHA